MKKQIYSIALVLAMMSATASAQNTQTDNIKPYTGQNTVMVGGKFGPYYAEVTYTIHSYTQDGVQKIDIDVPAYTLEGTVMGNLSLGAYTVTGLTYDQSREGYYKDYATDGLTMRFTATQGGQTTMDAVYPLSAAGSENILVQIDGDNATITNNFKPGAMPFPITAVMSTNTAAGILHTKAEKTTTPAYNLQGQRTSSANSQGIVIRNGKKYIAR